jgi:beta-glucosidase
MRLEDVPCLGIYPSLDATAQYREAINMGYRYYEKMGIEVKHPFGFGLSYTTFGYSGLAVSEKEASFTLENTGDASGAEIARIYIGREQKGVFRPQKELKAFTKVMLASGESKRVTVAFDDKAFRYYDTASKRWEVESGAYQVHVGSSSRDIRLVGAVELEGAAPCIRQGIDSYCLGNVKEATDGEFQALLGRPIPEAGWPKEHTAKMPLCLLKDSRSILARLIVGMLEKRRFKDGIPDLSILFILNIPMRAIAKMTNGMIDSKTADGLLLTANGHFLKGMALAAKDFSRTGKPTRDMGRY